MNVSQHLNVFCSEEIYLEGEIGKITTFVEPLSPEASLMEIFYYFMKKEDVRSLPIVDEYFRPIGLIPRQEFFEKIVLGRFGYGISLNYRKKAKDLMNRDILVLESSLSLEEAGKRLSLRDDKYIEQEIVVVEKEEYKGLVSVKNLLYFLSQKTLYLAQNSNPLTGLPGNWALRREIERRLNNKETFDVIYIDLNDFKPYNDTYGFAMGDLVITTLGELLKEVSKNFSKVFIGHIGGDDFVVVIEHRQAEGFCEFLIEKFKEKLTLFYHSEDLKRGYYESLDRRGIKKQIPLLSISCAILSSCNFSSFGELSSKASEVKAYVKKVSKESGQSFYFRDRRRA